MELSYFFMFYIVKISIFVAVLLYFTQISAQKAVLDIVSGPNRNLKHNAVRNPTAPAHIQSDRTNDDDDNNDNELQRPVT